MSDRILREPNAIWRREMRQAARLGRTPWALFALTLTLSLLMCFVGGLAAASDATPAAIGGALFQVFFSLAYLVVVVLGPAIAAGGVAAEREGRTWEAVLLTGLRPEEIARGKFLAAYTTIALYIVVLAPVGALPFLFGGVTATEVVLAFAFLFLVAGLAVAFGLAVSSLMSSQRGAIVVTMMLAIVFGPTLYAFFGLLASFGIHKVWSQVTEATPIWLPLACSRGTFGLKYVLLLLALPLLAVLMPAWLLHELTVANLGGEADDRSTGQKRWFAVCSPLFAVACAVPAAVAADDDSRVALSVAGLCAFALHLAFCAFLFAAEPPGPSRRVRVHWERRRAGAMTRFFGPGLAKTSALVAALGSACLWGIAGGDMTLVHALTTPSKAGRHVQEIFFFALYAAGFFLFVTGLTAWLRSRGQSPWIARLVAAALVLFVSAGPWVAAAIGGALARPHGDDWLVVGAPSPLYALYVIAFIDSASHATTNMPVVAIGAAASLLWGMLGVVLCAAAARSCRRAMRERDVALAAAQASLAAEDPSTPAPQTPAQPAQEPPIA